MGAHKRQLRNYLLDPKLQLRYTAMMVVLSALLTAGLGFFWYQQVRETSKTVEVRELAILDEAGIVELEADMKSKDRQRLLVLVGFGVLFSLIVAGYGIVLTHKIAGPLFKVARYMDQVREGKLGPVYDIRRGDQLHEFYAHFKEMHSALRGRAQTEVVQLDEFIRTAEQQLAQGAADSDEMKRALDELRALRDRKRVSLDGEVT